jgi:hypothetical protein
MCNSFCSLAGVKCSLNEPKCNLLETIFFADASFVRKGHFGALKFQSEQITTRTYLPVIKSTLLYSILHMGLRIYVGVVGGGSHDLSLTHLTFVVIVAVLRARLLPNVNHFLLHPNA